MASIDADAYTKPFQLTESVRRDVYPAVDPANNPELESSSKVVIVTGASGGLGSAIAKSWALAKAQGIILVGRKIDSLQAVASEIKGSKVLSVVGDITSIADVDAIYKKAIDEFGHVDVLVNAHGAMNVGPVGTIDPSQWWENFESNVRGVYNMSHGFIKATGGTGTIVNLASLAASFVNPGMSGYTASKLAVIKIGECIALEHPNLQVVAVHPGMVEAEAGRGMVVDALLPFSKDKQALTGGLTVYLATPRAAFLNGGYIHANWDVVELEKHKDEIAEKSLIKLGFLNGKLQPGGYPWSS